MAELDELTAELLSEKPLILARYVVAAYLQGHSFVEIGNSLRPSLREIFPDEEVKEENIYKEIEAQALFFHPYFVHEGQRIYLRRAQHCEKKIAEELLRLLKREAVSAFAFDREKLNAEQLQALEQASQHSIFCLLGGPGTGKTYTAGHFLQAFFTAFQGPLPQVALVGPTGKAAANLEKSIFKAMGNDKERLASYCHTKTLHALLQKGRSVSKQSFFNYQLIIVDEASMIDAATMAEFLSRVGPDTRLLFLGDPYQLPSVEAGEVLHECMHHIPHATLIECQRTDLKEILHLASLVKEGKAEEALHFIKSNNNAVSFHPASEENFQVSLDTAFRIISPKKSGPWGVDQMNSSFTSHHAGPLLIIITKNDYQLNLMNGQMGILKGKSAFFDDREIPALLLQHYEPAFCLSVHKSQGSEFDSVRLFLPAGSELFGRRMLYTAITRAKKEIQIFGTEETFRATIKNEGRRLSSISSHFEKTGLL